MICNTAAEYCENVFEYLCKNTYTYTRCQDILFCEAVRESFDLRVERTPTAIQIFFDNILHTSCIRIERPYYIIS